MTGLTRDGTWQLGVRRTVPLALDFVWQSLVDDPAALLGVPILLEPGAEAEADGIDLAEHAEAGYDLSTTTSGGGSGAFALAGISPGGSGAPAAAAQRPAPAEEPVAEQVTR
jgi:hypothetical protein